MTIATELEEWARKGAAASPDVDPGGAGLASQTCHFLATQAGPYSPARFAEAAASLPGEPNRGFPGLFSIAIDDAFELGRLTNQLRLGVFANRTGLDDTAP